MENGISQNNTEVNDASSKIETIKNLIFGENIQAYNSEFETLKKEINDKRNELKDLIEEVQSELNSLIDNVSTDVNIRITEVENNLNDKIENLDTEKVSKKTLGDLLIKLGNQIAD